MKNFFLTLCSFFLFSIALQAQPEVFFGGLLGVNKSNFTFGSFKDEYLIYVAGSDYSYKSTSKINGIQGGLRIGINLGSRLSLIADPLISKNNVSYKTDVTKEMVNEGTQDDPKFKLSDAGYRTWEIKMKSISVPIYLRFKLLGTDKFTWFALGGFSYSKLFKNGSFSTKYESDDTGSNGDKFANTSNPILLYYRDNSGRVNTSFKDTQFGQNYNACFYYSGQFPNGSSTNIKFGKEKTDNYNDSSFGILLGTGFKYNIDDEGKFALTMNINWNIGFSNTISDARRNYLDNIIKSENRSYVDLLDKTGKTIINYQDKGFSPLPVKIQNNQRLNTTLISIGFEFCPTCGGW